MNILFGPIIYTSSQIKLKRSHPSREDYICNDVCHWLRPFLRDQRQWKGNAQQDVQYIPLSDQNTIELCYLCKRLALNNLNIMTSLQIQTSCPNSNDPRKVSNIPKQYDIPDSKVHGANMGPPGSCRPQMGPMLAPWTLLSEIFIKQYSQIIHRHPPTYRYFVLFTHSMSASTWYIR